MSEHVDPEMETRERAQLLREAARLYRAIDPVELTHEQLRQLLDVIPSIAAPAESESEAAGKVRRLPVRQEPAAVARRLRLQLEASAADAERAADAIDEKLDAYDR